MATRFSQVRSVAPALVEQRLAPRHRVQLMREAQTADLPAQEVLLHDVSSYGCRVEGHADVAAGERLWLRLAAGAPTASTVVWRDGAQIGCRFDEPIDRGLMRALTRAIR